MTQLVNRNNQLIAERTAPRIDRQHNDNQTAPSVDNRAQAPVSNHGGNNPALASRTPFHEGRQFIGDNALHQPTPRYGNSSYEPKMRFKAPKPLEGENGKEIPVADRYERWIEWRGSFGVAAQICGEPFSEQQLAGLLYNAIGLQWQRQIRSLRLPPFHTPGTHVGREYTELLRGLESYFRCLVDEGTDYAKFEEAKQEGKEATCDYAMRLRGLAERAGQSLSSFSFRSQFLKGMRDKQLAERAMHYKMPLMEVIDVATRKEQTPSVQEPLQQWKFPEGPQPTASVAAINSNQANQSRRPFPTAGGRKPWQGNKALKRPATKPADGEPRSKWNNCKYCNRERHAKEDCPAFGKTCNNCKGKDHFESVCFKKKRTINTLATPKKENVTEIIENAKVMNDFGDM